MATASPKLEWCVVRLGDDGNWWVTEISDEIHWDMDGLGIIDPRQFGHIVDLMESLTEYGLKPEVIEDAFFSFTIDKQTEDGNVRLSRVRESLLESEDPLFALPDVMDEEKGPYADFLNHITRLRVKMLNDLIDFKQSLTIEELEEEIRESQNQDYLEGRSTHFFSEITAILEYVPEGFELDREDEEVKTEEESDIEDAFPDIEETEEVIEEDETMRWDEEDDDEDDEDADEDEEENLEEDEEATAEVEKAIEDDEHP